MLVLLLHNIAMIYAGLLAAAALAVFAWGDADERLAMWVIVAGSVATAWAARQRVWIEPESGIFGVDALMLAGFVIVMARSQRFWPLWIVALQIVSVATHLARFVRPRTVPMAYAVAEQAWSWVIIAILVVGVTRARLRRGSSGLKP